MNDPGTAEPMSQAERDVEHIFEDGNDPKDDEEIYNFLDPR
jgi:hypothetical protein